MKFLLCKSCQDVIKLVSGVERHCLCGKVGGIVIRDNLYAEYWGEGAIPIGFSNSSLVDALRNRPKKSGFGSRFEAFVMPEVCETMTKIEKK